MTFITLNATCYFNQKVLEKKQEIVLTYETNIINDDVLAIKSRYLFGGGGGGGRYMLEFECRVSKSMQR